MRRAAMLLVTVCCLAGATAAQATPSAGIARLGAAPAATQLELVLPLAVDDAALRSWALAVATPGSPFYRHYESIAQLARRFGAPAAVIRRATAYLRSHGATGVQPDVTGLWIDATMSASVAQRLFRTALARYHSAADGTFVAPEGAPSIPSALRGLITGVVGLDTRPVLSDGLASRAGAPLGTRAWSGPLAFSAERGGARAAAGQTPSGYLGPPPGLQRGCPAGKGSAGFTPNQYLHAYDYDPFYKAGLNGKGERVALIEIDGFRHSDIVRFANCFHGGQLPAIYTYGVRGVTHPLAPGGESTLDLEVLDAAAPGLKSIDVYESKPDSADAIRALSAPLHNPGHHPAVISASLGKCEPILASFMSSSEIQSGDDALAMAGASGTSILAASGDSGSADCLVNGHPVHQLAINYPASSWWVTGVGGTNLYLTADNLIDVQPVWNDTSALPGSAGGGGLSDLWYRPPYQKGTVGTDSRGVPDVAGLADVAPGYAIYCTASECKKFSLHPWQTIGGTSAATPLLAGGFALIDEYLAGRHRKALGLANPLLYQLAHSGARGFVYSDVLAINNDVGPWIGNHRPLGCCKARRGWDDASGWGSVDVFHLAVEAVGHR